MLLDRASLMGSAHRSHQAPRFTVCAASVVVDTHETEAVGNVDSHDEGKQQRAVAAPRRDFPELITEEAEPGEEQVYGAAAELVVEWRGAWAQRKAARHTLAWLRAERRILALELPLILLSAWRTACRPTWPNCSAKNYRLNTNGTVDSSMGRRQQRG